MYALFFQAGLEQDRAVAVIEASPGGTVTLPPVTRESVFQIAPAAQQAPGHVSINSQHAMRNDLSYIFREGSTFSNCSFVFNMK